MAYESNYSLEERVVTSTWAHERPHTRKSTRDIQTEFAIRFYKQAPSKTKILRWEEKLFETRSIKDWPRSGSPSTSKATCAEDAALVERSFQKSLRKRSKELRIPLTTLRNHTKQDLGLKAHRASFVNELNDNDIGKRREVCGRLLKVFQTIPARGKVIFSDKCAIHRSEKARNSYFWSIENSHFFEELERSPPHVMMICAAMSAKHLFGTYFFERPVNQISYLIMLRDWFTPQMEDLGLLGQVWSQQDGAPAHYAIAIRDYLSEVFGDKWIGRGSAQLPAPLEWSPRSPDLTPCDNALWAYIRG